MRDPGRRPADNSEIVMLRGLCYTRRKQAVGACEGSGMLNFQQLSTSISQIVSMCLLFVAVIGIMLTYQQMRQNHKIQKANFFKERYTTMFADADVRAAAYMIEYDKFVYNEDFHGSPQERIVDRLLSFADLVCDLYAQKLLSAHE